MPVDVRKLFEQGGRGLLDFLEYCVLSVRRDILFTYVVQEYRQRPTSMGAVAIYDMFCAAHAPIRISVPSWMTPKDGRLERALESYRHRQGIQPVIGLRTGGDGEVGEPATTGVNASGQIPSAPLLPPKYLFDSLERQLFDENQEIFSEVEATYDPMLTPHENLPSGKLSPGQRAFVDNVWLPVVRPRLVAGGFWRLATVG